MTAEEITDHWGERCTDFDEECPTCQVWRLFEGMADRQQRLEPDIEATIFKDIERLYEA